MWNKTINVISYFSIIKIFLHSTRNICWYSICHLCLHTHCVESVQIEFFQVRIFPHSDWIWTDTPYLSVFRPNVGKYEEKQLRIWTLFTQWLFKTLIISPHTITESSAILANACTRIQAIIFFAHTVFYTDIYIYHYSIFDLNYMLCYRISICHPMKDVLLMFLLHLFLLSY